MTPFRFLVVSDDHAEDYAADIVARRPSQVPTKDLVASSEHFLYVGGPSAESAGLDPQYRAARLLVDRDGCVGAVAFCDFACPDPHIRPHSIAFLAVAGHAFFVVCEVADAPVPIAAITIQGGRRLAYTRVHHPHSAPIGPSVAWWQSLIDEPSADKVLAELAATLPLYVAAFRWIAQPWTQVSPANKAFLLLRSIENSIIFEASESVSDDEGGSLILEGRWPWSASPCPDHPEDLAQALYERPFDRAIYPIAGGELTALRALLMPCGHGLRRRTRSSGRSPMTLHVGFDRRALLSGSFHLGRREFGIVQTQGITLRVGCRLRTERIGGQSLPVVATLIKAHDHRGVRNPEEQRGIGLVEISENIEEGA